MTSRPVRPAVARSEALTPLLRRRRGLWAVPLGLSLIFVAGVAMWAQRNERDERDEARRTLISDALSAEAQLRSRLDVEAAHLRLLADQLQGSPKTVASLEASPEVRAGFRRFWLSVTWLDERNRILAHVPEQGPLPFSPAEPGESGGLSSHLVTPVPPGTAALEPNAFDVKGEKLVVRYTPTVLLKRGVPWWLAGKYAVQLVDGSDQVIATLDDGPQRKASALRESYRVLVGGGMPGVFLELTEREPTTPWWRALPVALIGGFLLLIGVATVLLRRQVTQVMRAELAWRTEVAWRGAMEDSALVALRARDLEGRLLYVNRTFCDMVGLEAGALIGLGPPMPYWPTDTLEEVMQRHQRNLAGEAPREGYEARWRHRDGHLLDVMIFESPLVNAVGRQIGWMGSIVDITERKRLEERERRQVEAMAHQARLTTLGEVASALAHQLNQPLTAIAGYNAGVLRSLERAGYADEVVLTAVRRLGEQAREAGRIVQRIREFLTRRAPRRERCDLSATARRAADLLRRDLTRQGLRLEWRQPGELPPVEADPVLIEQVFINLMRNAADELAAAGRGGLLRMTLSVAGPKFVRVDVEDDGPGLRGLGIEALCAPFFSTKTEGMGMGLAICRSVVEAHHGSMDAGPSVLGGAHLSFTLPIHAPGLGEDAAAAVEPDGADATPECLPE